MAKSVMDKTVREVLEEAGVGARFRERIADHMKRNTRTYTEDGRKKTTVPEVSKGLLEKFFQQAMHLSPGLFRELFSDLEPLKTAPRGSQAGSE